MSGESQELTGDPLSDLHWRERFFVPHPGPPLSGVLGPEDVRHPGVYILLQQNKVNTNKNTFRRHTVSMITEEIPLLYQRKNFSLI